MSPTSLIRNGITLLICSAFAVSTAAAQTTWYVDDDAPNDPGPGDPNMSDPLEDGSADHPYDAIQEGIDCAVNGDTVLVADGTYTGVGNRDIDFGGRLITVCSETGPYNCRIQCGGEGIGFHFHNDETGEAILEGIWMFDAHVTGSRNGAVVCDESSPTITNCRVWASDGAGLFCNNAAPSVTECRMGYNTGAGVLCNNGAPTLSQCDIYENLAEGVRSEGSDLILEQCDIYENSAEGVRLEGSTLVLARCDIYENAQNGVFCDQGSIEITRCVVSENGEFGVYSDDAELLMTLDEISENGYGGICCDGGDSTIDRCTISDNYYYILGLGGGITIEDGDATISRCTITRNFGALSGGVAQWAGDLDVSDCVIAQNITVAWYGYAAGVLVCDGDARIGNCAITRNFGGFFGGGVGAVEANATVCNSVIARNDSRYWGGGIYCEWGEDVVLMNSTVVENTSEYIGSALFYWGNSATLVNSIVRDNCDPDGLPIGFDERDTPTLLVVSHCNIEDGESAVCIYDDEALVWGPGNIDADPLFVDPGESDYRLTAGSPCIDAGCNCGVPNDATDADGDGDTNEYTPFDLDGEGRFFDDPNTPDTGSGWPPVVDMGAYEFGDSELPPCRGDVDGDLDVDLADLTILLGNYGVTGGATGTDGDMNCDGDVGLHDLAQLLAVYGSTCEG